MNKSSTLMIAAALAAAVPAQAGFIDLNAPFETGISVRPLPGNMVEATAPAGWGGIVRGYVPPVPPGSFQSATATFGPLDLIGQPTTSQYNYSTSGSESLSFRAVITQNTNLIGIDSMNATLSWTSIYVVNDGSYSVGPSLTGTGIVTSSTGGDAFEADFPVGGVIDITANFLSECGRSPPTACRPNQPEVGGVLIGGSLVPVPTPSPALGQGWLIALLTLALLAVSRLLQQLRY